LIDCRAGERCGYDAALGCDAPPVCKVVDECNTFDPPQACSCARNKLIDPIARRRCSTKQEKSKEGSTVSFRRIEA